MQYDAIVAEFETACREFLALEMWLQAAQAKQQAAMTAYNAGKRAEYLRYAREAIEIAESHGLTEFAASLEVTLHQILLMIDVSGEIADRVRETIRGRRAAVEERYRAGGDERAYRTALTDILLLSSALHRKLRDRDSAREDLEEADLVSQPLPNTRWRVLLDLARLEDDEGDWQAALGHAEEAVRLVEPLQMPMLNAQVLEALAALTARRDAAEDDGLIDRLRASGDATAVTMALLQRAQVRLEQGRLGDSLRLLQDASATAPNPETVRAVVRLQAVVLYELGRYEDAAAAVARALTPLDDAWRDRRLERENLAMMGAWLKAKAGSPREAWDWAERGRTRSAQAAVTFDSVRAFLGTERASLLTFAVSRWGTLAISAGPDDREPETELLPFTHRELTELLAPPLEEDSRIWTQKLFAAVPALSAGLLAPLGDRIRALARASRVLYVIPDSFLFRAPFPALTIDKDTPLIAVTPIALAPSAGMMMQTCSRRGTGFAGPCLVVGVGEAEVAGESGRISFAEQAARVAALDWSAPPEQLLDQQAGVSELARLAPAADSLYICCHGTVSRTVQDSLAASQLALANGELLTAADVLGFKLNASLVFLNACQSGRFRLTGRSDIDGFSRAFLHAGAASLVSTLIHVDPRPAAELAEQFFRAWIGGAGKAEALQEAQLKLRDSGAPHEHWAAHTLLGDYL